MRKVNPSSRRHPPTKDRQPKKLVYHSLAIASLEPVVCRWTRFRQRTNVSRHRYPSVGWTNSADTLVRVGVEAVGLQGRAVEVEARRQRARVVVVGAESSEDHRSHSSLKDEMEGAAATS